MADVSESTRGLVRWVVVVVVVVAAVAAVIIWRSSGRQATDDAQIEGRITPIAARVGGHIVKIAVAENQYVEAGTVLAEIDPQEYQVAVDRARAELADARANALAAGANVPIADVTTASGMTSASGGVDESRAGITVADRQVEAARSQLLAARARLRERQSTATKVEKDVERFKPLVAKEEIAQQQFDAAVAAAESARASADAAQSDVDAASTGVAVAEQHALQARASASRAQAQLEEARTAPDQRRVARARASSADARVKQAEAVVAQAELNLERTVVKAPTAGFVGRKAIELGQTVQPAQPLLALISRDDVWVVANFKETQLAQMRPGQPATLEVDALGKVFRGKVDSLGSATGAKFSLLPPENATGNYVKVVQRLPVKIVLDPGQDPEHRLRPGLSVYASVSTK